MAFRLGIDAGGTYTDGVIWDDSKQKIIAKAKALTTHGNLVEGITNCLQALKFFANSREGYTTKSNEQTYVPDAFLRNMERYINEC